MPLTRRSLLKGFTAGATVGPVADKLVPTPAWANPDPDAPNAALPPEVHAVARGDDAYEARRQAAVWQIMKPDRFPGLIVEAHSQAEVIDVVRYARAHHLTIAVKGSGHNYAGTFLRDGGILLDLSQMKAIGIDGVHAQAEPGVRSVDLCEALTAKGRAFPTGHHFGVTMGGYLLGGGMGWNGESWGELACFNIAAVDIVTAAGEAVRASPSTHPDLYWAARGAGPGFFGVVTRYHLNTFPLPTAMHASSYVYPLAAIEAVSAWLAGFGKEKIPNLELFLMMATENHPDGTRTQTCNVDIVSYVSDKTAAQTVLERIAKAAPAGAVQRDEILPITFADLYADSLTGGARRLAADTIWSNTAAAACMVLAKHYASVPSAASAGIVNFRGAPKFPASAAASAAGEGFLQWLCQWDDQATDPENLAWVETVTQALEPYSVGSYVNESDILRWPARARRCYSPTAWAKLNHVRMKYDPTGLFPPPFQV